METLIELTEPSIRTFSFSFLLTTTGVSNSSLLLLETEISYSCPPKRKYLLDFNFRLIVSFYNLRFKILNTQSRSEGTSDSIKIWL